MKGRHAGPEYRGMTSTDATLWVIHLHQAIENCLMAEGHQKQKQAGEPSGSDHFPQSPATKPPGIDM